MEKPGMVLEDGRGQKRMHYWTEPWPCKMAIETGNGFPGEGVCVVLTLSLIGMRISSFIDLSKERSIGEYSVFGYMIYRFLTMSTRGSPPVIPVADRNALTPICLCVEQEFTEPSLLGFPWWCSGESSNLRLHSKTSVLMLAKTE